MIITRTDPTTGKTHSQEINATEKQFILYNEGSAIQYAMPQLTADEREFIMTGITPQSWFNIFKERYYFTFGQNHLHNVGGAIFNKDTVVFVDILEEKSAYGEAREKMVELFSDKWAFQYSEEQYKEQDVARYYNQDPIDITNFMEDSQKI